MPIVKDLLREITLKLNNSGITSPYLESLLICAHILEKPKEFLIAHPELQVNRKKINEINKLVNRRAKKEPISYILGSKEFMGLQFFVGQGVLIPRPETEVLVERLIKEIQPRAKVADIGTGSGAIALSLKYYRPDLEVVGTDISNKALTWAKKNANHLKVNVKFIRSDLLNEIQEPFDVIVSNPPYVATHHKVDPEVMFEPSIALWAGDDGLDIIKELIPQAFNSLNNNGLLYLELDPRQITSVYNWLLQYGFKNINIIKDLSDKKRFFKAQKLGLL